MLQLFSNVLGQMPQVLYNFNKRRFPALLKVVYTGYHLILMRYRDRNWENNIDWGREARGGGGGGEMNKCNKLYI
jgi:hypothetical protein